MVIKALKLPKTPKNAQNMDKIGQERQFLENTANSEDSEGLCKVDPANINRLRTLYKQLKELKIHRL